MNRSRVLIVDDNADLASALKAVLESSDPRLVVETAGSGAQALQVAAKQGIDVAIVDVQLPDWSGVELIAPLRERAPNAEVVLVTGYASVDAAIAALRSGAFAFALKSFRPDEIVTTVQQALARVRLTRERDELEQRYRALVELTDVLVIGLDDDGCVVFFNPKACAAASTTPEAAAGRPFVETWLPEPDRARMREAIHHARNVGPREVETDFTDRSRRLRWHWSFAPGEGTRGVIYGIGIDITERRVRERRAAEADALSAMGQLAMNLAHEIRNPLNAALLQLNLLRRQVAKLEVDNDVRVALHKRAEVVGDEVGRLNRLLTDFLELARPRAAAREPVHLSNLVGDVLDLQSGSAEGRGIAVVRELAAEGCVAMGDAAKLKQVVLNVVVNALEAMKSGGTLTARVQASADRVTILIEDTGAGISPEHLATVFDPFFTTKEAGTGLGLSIVQRIVEQHGGDVKLTSERGRGTRVQVAIPTGR